jgi:hypothetical protein
VNIIELDHETDPRYLLVTELPERVTVEDLGERRYGKPLSFCPFGPPRTIYKQPSGPGTDWVRP